MIALALQHVLPHKAVPQVYKTGMPTVIVGTNPPHREVVHGPLRRGVRGVVQRRGGHGRLGLSGRGVRQPVEGHGRDQREPVPPCAVEPGLPHRLRRTGAMAGLCGSHYVKQVRTDGKVYTYVVGMKYPMPGIAGGQSGAPNQLTIRWGSDDPFVVQHTADWVPISAGERICYDYGGGGGWGDRRRARRAPGAGAEGRPGVQRARPARLGLQGRPDPQCGEPDLAGCDRPARRAARRARRRGDRRARAHRPAARRGGAPPLRADGLRRAELRHECAGAGIERRRAATR